MCRFEIYKNNVENSSVTLKTKGNYRDINEAIYECLTERFEVDEETAIDIACWCELALVDDVYETDDITVIVQEEVETKKSALSQYADKHKTDKTSSIEEAETHIAI